MNTPQTFFKNKSDFFNSGIGNKMRKIFSLKDLVE